MASVIDLSELKEKGWLARRAEREKAEDDLHAVLSQDHDSMGDGEVAVRTVDINTERPVGAGSNHDGEQGNGNKFDDDTGEGLPSERTTMTTTIVVTRPHGTEVGAEMQVETGDGRSFSVAIPEGVEPGDEFEIEFENIAASADLSDSWQEATEEDRAQAGEEPQQTPDQTLVGATQNEEEQEEVDAFDDELADLLGSSDESDSEDTDFQDVDPGNEEDEQESPRAVRARKAEELRNRLASLESDAGLPSSTGLPLAATPDNQNGRYLPNAADTSVESAAEEEDPFSALAALLPG